MLLIASLSIWLVHLLCCRWEGRGTCSPQPPSAPTWSNMEPRWNLPSWSSLPPPPPMDHCLLALKHACEYRYALVCMQIPILLSFLPLEGAKMPLDALLFPNPDWLHSLTTCVHIYWFVLNNRKKGSSKIPFEFPHFPVFQLCGSTWPRLRESWIQHHIS